MKDAWIKIIMTGLGLLLIFFSPVDAGLSAPVGLGLIAAAWLEKW
jgi:hypothetical protein